MLFSYWRTVRCCHAVGRYLLDPPVRAWTLSTFVYSVPRSRPAPLKTFRLVLARPGLTTLTSNPSNDPSFQVCCFIANRKAAGELKDYQYYEYVVVDQMRIPSHCRQSSPRLQAQSNCT